MCLVSLKNQTCTWVEMVPWSWRSQKVPMGLWWRTSTYPVIPTCVAVWLRTRLSLAIITLTPSSLVQWVNIYTHTCSAYIYSYANLFSFSFSKNSAQYFMRTKVSYKIDCSLRLQTHSIYFYWRWILTNPPLDYIFFLYPPCLQNFKKIKDQ